MIIPISFDKKEFSSNIIDLNSHQSIQINSKLTIKPKQIFERFGLKKTVKTFVKYTCMTNKLN